VSEVILIRGAALILAALGIWLLRNRWRASRSRKWPLTAAWISLLASITLWGFTSGADKGVALGIIAVILAAMSVLLATALSTEKRKGRSQPSRTPVPRRESRSHYLRKLWVGLLIGPISGFAALAVSTLAFAAFDGVGLDHSMNLAIVSISFPTVWAALAVFAGFETRLFRKSAGVIATGMLPLLLIFVSSSGV
jgi:riboflavin transporter FmnP